MQFLRGIIFTGLPVMLTVAAAGLAVWAWSNGWPLLTVLLTSVILLAAGQLMVITGGLVNSLPWRRHVRDIVHVLSHMKGEISRMTGRVERLEKVLRAKGDRSGRRPSPTSGRFPARGAPAAGFAHVPAGAGRDNGHRPSGAARGEPDPAGSFRDAGRTNLLDGFMLYMEPVVDLRRNVTGLYRALPALPASERDHIYLGGQAMLMAAQTQIALDLDLRTLGETANFARRLAARGHAIPVICPVSAEALPSLRFHERLRVLLEEDAVPSSLLILEISQRTLASLTDRDIEGLARLARTGVRLSLGEAGPGQVDADALATLGFAYVDMDAAALLRLQAQHDAPEIATITEAGLKIIASGIDEPETGRRIRSLVELARGRAYSPPRRVRSAFSTGKESADRRPGRPLPFTRSKAA